MANYVIAGALFVFMVAVPLFWMVTTALKTNSPKTRNQRTRVEAASGTETPLIRAIQQAARDERSSLSEFG